jgi:N-acyl-L-homoserine lactone synthetase
MSSNNLSTLNLPITNTLDRPDVSNIGFVIPGYKSYIAITQEQKDKAYRLRHEVYSKELKWVPESLDGREIDEFDAHAFLVCVENDIGDLIGTIRVIDSVHQWLSQTYFAETITDGVGSIKAMSCVESSRNAVSVDYRVKRLGNSKLTVFDLMLCTAMEFTREILMREHVLVTAAPIMGVILKRRGGAIRQVGPIVTMPDKYKIASFILDLSVCKDTYDLYHSCIALHEQCISNATDGDKSVASA